jgi:hypothetical protein
MKHEDDWDGVYRDIAGSGDEADEHDHANSDDDSTQHRSSPDKTLIDRLGFAGNCFAGSTQARKIER